MTLNFFELNQLVTNVGGDMLEGLFERMFESILLTSNLLYAK